jgi:ferrous iron transport protein B
MKDAEKNAEVKALANGLTKAETENLIASTKLENSYAGIFGKAIEPIIKPLGFDWKIGIALITSFAAREVFVGTMSTIYSVGSEEEGITLKEKMMQEKDPLTGAPIFTPALAFSLLIFYLFAMQCMSTLAVTYRETKTWKWPVLQFTYMTGLAYISSFCIYNLLK